MLVLEHLVHHISSPTHPHAPELERMLIRFHFNEKKMYISVLCGLWHTESAQNIFVVIISLLYST